ncbi:MAG: prepilin-type N-terminal cleavage/methylation domain-containing protein [Elusimicrobiota bacterium]|jgi:prepilin-type N-terminal cleavage/methylation domain-containing protein
MDRTKRNQQGFTLIELLVVVLIIGILASIAIPQYFKVVERARVSEAQAFISQVKQAQERYLTRNGVYINANSGLANMDVTFSGADPNYGMKFFSAAIGAGSATGCNAGDPTFNIVLTRNATNAGIAARYGGGAYAMVYERCQGKIVFPSCANCDIDFAQ